MDLCVYAFAQHLQNTGVSAQEIFSNALQGTTLVPSQHKRQRRCLHAARHETQTQTDAKNECRT